MDHATQPLDNAIVAWYTSSILRSLPITQDPIQAIFADHTEREQVQRKAKWLPLYNKVILLDQKGWKDDSIAKQLKLATKDLQDLRKTPEYRDRYNQLVESTRIEITDMIAKKKSTVEKAIDELTGHVPWAIGKLVDLAATGDSSQRIQLDACKEILDRANVKSPDVSIIEHRQHTPEELNSMKTTLIEIESIRTRLSNQDSRFVRSVKSSMSQSSLTDESSSGPISAISPGPD